MLHQRPICYMTLRPKILEDCIYPRSAGWSSTWNVEQGHQGEEGHFLMKSPICENIIVRPDEDVVLKAPATPLSKLANRSAATLKLQATFVDVMRPLVSYYIALSFQYSTSLLHSRIKSTVEDKMSFWFPPVWGHTMCPSYERHSKVFWRMTRCSLRLTVWLKKQEQGRAWNYCVWAPTASRGPWRNTRCSWLRLTIFFIKNATKTPQFQAALFDKASNPELTALKERYTWHSSVEHGFFQSCITFEEKDK